ncbi:MAG: trigger factor [Desulfobulbaceae bacterium]|nr:trigger factor [Desulfobulbaceae bacterium]
MDIAVENISELTRKLTITIPSEDVSKALDKAYNKLKKDVHIKGFRRGKAPRTVLEKNYRDQVRAEVGEKLVQETYFDAVEKEGLDTVVHPEIVEHNFTDDGTFSYIAMVDIKPEFELSEYKGLEVEKPATDVSQSEVDEKLEELRRGQAVLKSADDDHGIENDDLVVVDFQGFHNGKAMKEVHNTDYSIDVGQHRLGEEFETKLLGLKKNEKTLYEIEFPGDYPNPVLGGKTVEFKVDIKDVKVRIKPELDDEFAKDINPEHESLDDLRKEIEADLKKAKEDALAGELDDRIMQKLIKLNEFEVPERLVMYEVQEMVKQTEEHLKRSNLTMESAGINLEDLIENNKPVAEKRVRGDFLLKKVAEVEEIKLADEDIERGYKRIAGEYNMTVAEVKSYFKRREEVLPFINELLNEKILQFLRDNAKFIEATAEETA